MKSGLSRNQWLRGKSAYTLAEVVIAVAVVGIAFVSLYRGILFAFDTTRFERENLRATQVILRRLEGIRLFNWNQISDPTLNPHLFSEHYLPGSSTNDLVYSGTVDVSPVTLDPPASYSGNMKKVTVTVTWTSDHVLRTRSASTYVARDGVQNYIYSN
jgi:type II secretory pathway pseudopilin PulG